jgi:acyl-CoA thioesterase
MDDKCKARALTDHLGFEHHEAPVDGVHRVSLELSDIHMSSAGRVHGGVLFSLLDTAMGGAVISALPLEKGCATLEMKINYFRPVQSGKVTAVGRLINLTKNTAYAEGEVFNEEGRLLAKTSGTFFITATRKQSERERI